MADVEFVQVKVADLKPNPYRDLKAAPLRQNKIDALVESINTTGFWDNLVARRNADGEIETVYGHHRVAALKEVGQDEIRIQIRDKTEDQMLMEMVRENREEFGHDADAEISVVRVTLKAYAEGKIERIKPEKPAGTVRYVFSSPRGDKKLYTLESLGKYLNWPQYKLLAILGILDEERKPKAKALITQKDISGLSTRQAQEVLQQARRAERATKQHEVAREVVNTLVEGMRPGSKGRYDGEEKATVTIHNARDIADSVIFKGGRRKKEKKDRMPNVEDFTAQMIGAVNDTFSERARERLDAIVEHFQHVSPQLRQRLIQALKREASMATKYAERLARAAAKAKAAPKEVPLLVHQK